MDVSANLAMSRTGDLAIGPGDLTIVRPKDLMIAD
jgi:hypothetical protein